MTSRAAAALAILLLAGPAQAATHLTLGVAAVSEFTPVFVAENQHYFAAHDLDVTLQIVPNSSTLIPALLSDSVQIGGPPAPVFLQAIGQDLPIVCFAAGSLTDPNQPVGAVLAPPAAGIRTPADLAGKRLAVSGINSIMQILLRQWLVERHANPAATTYVEVPFSRMEDALKSGSVDAVLEVQPFVTRMQTANVAKIALDYYRDVPANTLSTAYCGSSTWATAHIPVLAAFRAAIEDAASFITQHPAEAHKILADTLHLPPDVAANLPFATYRSALLPSQITWWVQTLRDQNLLEAPLDPATVILPIPP